MFTPPTVDQIPTPQQLIAVMDETVAGLDKVKQQLAVTLWRFMVSAALGRSWRPANLLVIGGSGTGKTYALRKLMEACPVIWTEATATEYSDVGFTGRNLTSMYHPLTGPQWRGSGGEKHSMATAIGHAQQHGVVLLDEFDKLRVPKGTLPGDRAGSKYLALQAELLKLVEGSEIQVALGDSQGFGFRTHGVLHIAIGAFSGLEDIIKAKDGLSAHVADLTLKAGIWDIVQYGFTEELVGRFASIVPLPSLKPEALVRIINEQIIGEYASELQDLGLTLQIDDGAISWVASFCSTAGDNPMPIGARAIRPLLDAILWPALVTAMPGDRIVIGVHEAQLQHATVVRPTMVSV